ncbi:uncharacterized protein LOC123549513 [Mercenaria mercenaria]|uniref:uncharacterized protein LOC123549513 n=1 Tax=Mercenaria mercenaria TaxID=6596 RepID=UPI001E1DD4B7|nr:uncharacterized protein LOC123549513 [Mercenaria mercenaria]
METSDELEKIKELENRLDGWETEEDDAGFKSQQTYRRYLEARDWNVEAAEKILKATIDWRRETKPQHVVCTYCHAKPGYHAMRHVGFDRHDRPVLYSNFAQCHTQHNVVEDAIQHMIYLTENATRAMPAHVYQFVWVMDFTGMKVTSCNPRLARAVEQITSNHYPERLGACVCVNHGPLFHAFWKAVKHFIPPTTVRKVHMERHHEKIEVLFSELFPDELKHWLYEEIRLNKLHPLPKQQKEFWTTTHTGHDTRGCKSYVEKYLNNLQLDEHKSKCNTYLPHPNILDDIIEMKKQ